jgi:hypothetical protein
VNSDDLLAPGALDHVARLYQDCPEAGILACSMEHFTRTPADACDKVTPQGWSPEGFLRVPKQGAFSFNQPGVFFTRYLYERIGGLDRPLHMCMDYDLFLRMSETGPRIVYSSRTTAFFRHHAGSKTTCGMVKNLIREHAEFLQIYNDAFRRTGIAADRSRSVNLLHWWLFRAAWHADFANMRLAYQALAELDHRSPRDISGRIGVLLLRRLFQGSRV